MRWDVELYTTVEFKGVESTGGFLPRDTYILLGFPDFNAIKYLRRINVM